MLFYNRERTEKGGVYCFWGRGVFKVQVQSWFSTVGVLSSTVFWGMRGVLGVEGAWLAESFWEKHGARGGISNIPTLIPHIGFPFFSMTQ